MRRFLSLCAVFFLCSSSIASSDETTNTKKDGGYVINFNNVHVSQYLRFITNISGINFTFDENELNFNLTIVSKTPSNLEDIMAALLQNLQSRGFGATQQGNMVIIQKLSGDQKGTHLAPVFTDSKATTPIATRVFELEFASPDAIAKIVTPMLSKEAIVEFSTITGHVIVTDLKTNIDKVEKLLASLDTPVKSPKSVQYKAKHLYIDTLQSLAEKLLKPIAGDNPLVIVPQTSSNSLFIVSTPSVTQKALSILETLDTPPEGQALFGASKNLQNSNFFLYPLQYHKGDKIAESLQKVTANLVKTEVVSSQFAETVNSLQWIETTNSLLFMGDPQSFGKVETLLKTLDVPSKQVFIEVLVIDTTVTNALNFGVDWSASHNGKGVLGSFMASPPSSSSNLSGVLSDPLATHTVADLYNGGSLGSGLNLGFFGKAITHNGKPFLTVGSLINALKSDIDTRILMNPRIMTQNNVEATVFVGENIPFVTNQSVTTPSGNNDSSTTSTSIDYRNVGTTLTVTPLINDSNDAVTLFINQKVETAAVDSSLQIGTNVSAIRTSTAQTTTRVQVPNNSFLVLSGQIKETKTRTKKKVPCLGTLPVAGAAFKNDSDSREKRNIMIFLRPQIVNTPQEMSRLTENMRQKTAEPETFRDLNFLDIFNLNFKKEKAAGKPVDFPEPDLPTPAPASKPAAVPAPSSEPDWIHEPAEDTPPESLLAPAE